VRTPLLEDQNGKGFERFTISRRIVLRRGYVRQVHEQGHILCRGPCVETTIPVLAGMSGGPAFLDKEDEQMKVFGLISTDDKASASLVDKTVPGSAILALLPCEISNDHKRRKVRISFGNAPVLRGDGKPS
jgi:hypothetical protein